MSCYFAHNVSIHFSEVLILNIKIKIIKKLDEVLLLVSLVLSMHTREALNAYQGSTSPFACQKVPLFDSVSWSILASSPSTDCSGEIPFSVKSVMRVLTHPG